MLLYRIFYAYEYKKEDSKITINVITKLLSNLIKIK